MGKRNSYDVPTPSPSRRPLFSVTKEDLRIEFTKGTGKGGQKKNKTSSAVRITHPPSGAVGYAQDERSQEQNRKLAFRRMYSSNAFQVWLKKETAERMVDEAAIERRVDEMMRPRYLKVEFGPFEE